MAIANAKAAMPAAARPFKCRSVDTAGWARRRSGPIHADSEPRRRAQLVGISAPGRLSADPLVTLFDPNGDSPS